jgi:hypothetical protein
MKYIALFPNTDPTLDAKVCVGAADIEAESEIDAARQATLAVPRGWPIIVYPQSEYDKTFHSAYEPNWKDRIWKGTNEKMRNNFLAMGYTEEFYT